LSPSALYSFIRLVIIVDLALHHSTRASPQAEDISQVSPSSDFEGSMIFLRIHLHSNLFSKHKEIVGFWFWVFFMLVICRLVIVEILSFQTSFYE